MKINEIRPLESDFTEVLETIALKPKMLYYSGKMPENGAFVAEKGSCDGEVKGGYDGGKAVVAIVGTRRNTAYGREVAYKLAYELARQGAIIVSGMAMGIDSIAHRGCLDAGGTTVAVFGTPIDEFFPRNHAGLAREIVEKGGMIMSEYGPGERAGSSGEAKARFLARNRLISGLSRYVIVVEAHEKSGSLNTAGHALGQGREVFAVPGDINRPGSLGCNKLIFQGANPVVSVEEVVKTIFPVPRKKRERAAKYLELAETPAERAVLSCLMKGLRGGEEILVATDISPAEFSQATTILEIRGVIKPLGMNNWMIV